MPKIIPHPTYGFKTFDEIPSDLELVKYYQEKYFSLNPNYSYEMQDCEIIFKRYQASFLIDVLQYEAPKALSYVVEIGSGEGFFLHELHNRNIDFQGIDFSADQLHVDNICCKDRLTSSVAPIASLKQLTIKPSCVVLRHVIEHVPNAVEAIKEISDILEVGGCLVVEAPYDFKPIQEYILERKISPKEYWVCYPDHLSYFTPENLSAILNDFGFEISAIYGDFPIELMLLSGDFNYQTNKSMGRPSHLLRCEASNYLYENTPFADLYDLYKSFAKCGISRSFSLIAQKK